MNKLGWVILSVLVLGFCFAGVPAHAQDGKISLFGGYSFETNNFNGFDPTIHGYTAAAAFNFNRHIALEANFSGHNGTSTIVSQPPTSTSNGEIDVVRQDIYTYTLGPKLSLPVGHFSIFTHFLVGGAHIHEGFTDKCLLSTGGETSCLTTDTGSWRGNGFAFKTGGGVDWNHGCWGIRILEVDYSHAEVYTTETASFLSAPRSFPATANNFELATGVTFNLK